MRRHGMVSRWVGCGPDVETRSMKGFGFITPDNGSADIFVIPSALQAAFRVKGLTIGDRVEYAHGVDGEGRLQAEDVVRLEAQERSGRPEDEKQEAVLSPSLSVVALAIQVLHTQGPLPMGRFANALYAAGSHCRDEVAAAMGELSANQGRSKMPTGAFGAWLARHPKVFRVQQIHERCSNEWPVEWQVAKAALKTHRATKAAGNKGPGAAPQRLVAKEHPSAPRPPPASGIRLAVISACRWRQHAPTCCASPTIAARRLCNGNTGCRVGSRGRERRRLPHAMTVL